MKKIVSSATPRRVQATLIWPLAVVLAVLLVAFITTVYLLERGVRDGDLAERMASVQKLLDRNLEKDANLMRAVLRTLRDNQAVGAALAGLDRAALMRETGPLFETLGSEHRITHFYFDRPDLVNLLRLHSPAEYGDLIDRSTTTLARDRARPVSGLELGPLGTLTLRTVMPWLESGRTQGYVELGKEIEHIVQDVHENLSVDLFVLVDKRFMSEQQWRHGLTLLNRQGQWSRFNAYVTVAQTTNSLPDALNDKVLEALRAGASKNFNEGDRIINLNMIALTDAGGRRVGDLVVMRDITALQYTFLRSITLMTLLSLLAAGGVLGLYYFAVDRLDRDYQRQHELEHQLLRLNTEHQRMLQIEKLSALGTMVGEIAHQLNNPLVGVVNLAQLAAREADDPARTRELLAEIGHAGEDCHALIQSMLRFSKVSNFESEPTAMAQVVNETVLLFRQTESRRTPVNIRLPERAVMLTVDPILIRHALFNLLTNADQASAGAGEILIVLEPAVNPDSGVLGWRLSVADQGSGIAPDLMDRIFQPFFTTRKDGTGLGLPVVQQVALLHRGTVSVSRRPQCGTIFAIWLPQDAQLMQENPSDQ
ncbi:MAG: histidine kinase [Gammaproteobacteria bacterium]|uniref:ATP-binding protein n=1 Tax=Rhodoferax sp. TaxID=50421 RepID=UPI00179D8BB7|nr:ATP-binding protein [Rhodoferax sp.]MBU3899842.1 histidine kinase [Gammaproteobacteria bacterium]MBA3057954.1 histidine kinase [Rhodoferax sp.]MBU3996025.1 histidine kinase [Gammaproteobacteria bacterium]MBU4019107.1 histidine kinase [Gammaproteobacteria bacterium]MBU4078825.1 histidine kinase [Gammaproteobacteria bacterium]